MILLRTLIFTAFLVLLPTRSVTAQETGPSFPEPLGETVSDFAGTLDATEEGRISRILAETREKAGVEVIFVTADGPSALNAPELRLEEVGRALFDAWGVGGKDRNDGILVLIDTRSREARIALGSGYPEVYDERAARVLSTALLPLLREGQDAAAIEAAIVLIRDQLIAPFQAGEPVSATDGFEDPYSGLAMRIGIALVGILGFLAVSFWRRVRARKLCPNCRALTLKRESEIILSPTKYQEGIALEHRTCMSCGFVDRHSYSIPPSDHDRRSKAERLAALQAQTDGRDDAAPEAVTGVVEEDRKR